MKNSMWQGHPHSQSDGNMTSTSLTNDQALSHKLAGLTKAVDVFTQRTLRFAQEQDFVSSAPNFSHKMGQSYPKSSACQPREKKIHEHQVKPLESLQVNTDQDKICSKFKTATDHSIDHSTDHSSQILVNHNSLSSTQSTSGSTFCIVRPKVSVHMNPECHEPDHGHSMSNMTSQSSVWESDSTSCDVCPEYVQLSLDTSESCVDSSDAGSVCQPTSDSTIIVSEFSGSECSENSAVLGGKRKDSCKRSQRDRQIGQEIDSDECHSKIVNHGDSYSMLQSLLMTTQNHQREISRLEEIIKIQVSEIKTLRESGNNLGNSSSKMGTSFTSMVHQSTQTTNHQSSETETSRQFKREMFSGETIGVFVAEGHPHISGDAQFEIDEKHPQSLLKTSIYHGTLADSVTSGISLSPERSEVTNIPQPLIPTQDDSADCNRHSGNATMASLASTLNFGKSFEQKSGGSEVSTSICDCPDILTCSRDCISSWDSTCASGTQLALVGTTYSRKPEGDELNVSTMDCQSRLLCNSLKIGCATDAIYVSEEITSATNSLNVKGLFQ